MAECKDTCPGCGDPLPNAVLCSVSHTIDPGKRLCTPCGQKETCDPVWADGIRIGWDRYKAAMASMDMTRKQLKGSDDG